MGGESAGSFRDHCEVANSAKTAVAYIEIVGFYVSMAPADGCPARRRSREVSYETAFTEIRLHRSCGNVFRGTDSWC